MWLHQLSLAPTRFLSGRRRWGLRSPARDACRAWGVASVKDLDVGAVRARGGGHFRSSFALQVGPVQAGGPNPDFLVELEMVAVVPA